MKKWIWLCLLAMPNNCVAQDVEEQQEMLAASTEEVIDDDGYLQMLERSKKHRINLNTCSDDALRLLQLLTEVQIQSFVVYRKLFGSFISIYELQAIPAWNVPTIRRLLPYITLEEKIAVTEALKKRLYEGDKTLLLRAGAKTGKKESNYAGNAMTFQWRYKYQFKNLLQYGLLGEKDAGEKMISLKEKRLFDFSSFHFFVRELGRLKSLALGDYTINLGQGLLQWQSMAFKKGPGVLNIKRQGPVLKPYQSAGEYNFHRGAAAYWKFGRVELVPFISSRRLDANVMQDSTGNASSFISSIITNGYHRTPSEIAHRGVLRMFSIGGSVRVSVKGAHIGVNGVAARLSKWLQKDPEPYNLYAFRGNKLGSVSTDYSYTHRNFHLFGETALDHNGDAATINGFVASVHQTVDLSMLVRIISKSYDSFFANAFTEAAAPLSEKGIYTGVSWRPGSHWQMDAYADMYYSAWLRFRVNAPSFGNDYFVQLQYAPSKALSITSRLRIDNKPTNAAGLSPGVAPINMVQKKTWRIEVRKQEGRGFTLSSRVEVVRHRAERVGSTPGFIAFAEAQVQPERSWFAGQARLQFFDAGSYDARVYALESDLLYVLSVPAFYGAGWRWYVNCRVNPNHVLHLKSNSNIKIWVKIAQTIAINRDSMESINNEGDNLRGWEFRIQLLLGT
jgi:hypothetical protein